MIEMIFNFPKPFDDETLYSIIARHRWLQPLSGLKKMVHQCFGHERTAVVDLPCGLETLVSRIQPSSKLTAARLLRDHTTLPYYAPFLPPERLGQIQRDLAGDGGGVVHLRTGIMAGTVRPPQYLRFCPSCAAEERLSTGEAYWHRLHQLPGIQVCPNHRVFFEDSSVARLHRRTRHEFAAAEAAIPTRDARPVRSDEPAHQILLNIAHSAAWLLQNHFPAMGLSNLHHRYIREAMKRGYATGTGNIRWAQLLVEFRKRYPEQLLQELQCAVPRNNSGHWLARILRRPRTVQSPVRHLLLLDFLGLRVEQLFNSEFVNPVFGAGPWLCENTVCPEYMKKTVRQVMVEHNHEHNQPVGVFTCVTCGRTYCVVQLSGRESKWTRDFGVLWKTELTRLWKDPNVSLRSIAKRLGVDPKTVKCYATKEGMDFPRQGIRITGAKGPPSVDPYSRDRLEDLVQRREEWADLRNRRPTDCVTQIRQHAPACYMYLYRHDRQWLEKQRPVAKPKMRRARIDWHERDLILSRQVDDAKAALVNKKVLRCFRWSSELWEAEFTGYEIEHGGHVRG